ncbi:hypothetical protein K4K58_002020 [Colletotrichum sp. SAR11_239]|nr:hypothetical protein K4K58_002020 [Colletotrichum sp. SAR11_239]
MLTTRTLDPALKSHHDDDTLYALVDNIDPQVLILHRGGFTALCDRVYASDSKKRAARELYVVIVVFAIGSGTIMSSHTAEQNGDVIQTMMDKPDAPPPYN